MRLFEVLNLAKNYLILGVIGLILIAIIYFVFFRRFLKNHVDFNIKKVTVFSILFCYIVIVIGATIFMRSEDYGHANLNLFSSYIEAWNNYSKSYWRNIILNILMFMPLGFLLPIFNDKLKNPFLTLGIGFLFTLGIETTQYITKRGIFELDDIMNNWIGALLGYTLIMFLFTLFSKTKRKLLKLIFYILPTLIAIFVGYKIIETYNSQRFGNLSSNYNYVYDMSNVSLDSEVKFIDSEKNEKNVYILNRLSNEDALKFAQDFFEKLGTTVDESDINTYDNEIFFTSSNKRYKINIYLNGGVYNFIDFKCSENIINKKMDEKDVVKVLQKYNIKFYHATKFEEQKEDEEALSAYSFLIDLNENNDNLTDGKLTVSQSNEMFNIDNYIYNYKYYGTFKVISQKQAYERIKAGRFNSYELYNIKSILIRSIKLCYQLDSKGYYQPVYRFECTIDGDGRAIFIPALEDIN